MCTLGQVDAPLGVSWEDFVATWVSLGAILGYVGAILGPFWGVLGATWVHLGAGSLSMESTHLLESIAGACVC